jgi:CBS domain containing-hemolysin-like protein
MVLFAVAICAALIFVNAVYVAAEFAAVSVRRARIRQLASERNPLAAWLSPILEDPKQLDRYIAVCQIGITLSSLILGAYAQATFAVWLSPVLVELGNLQQIAAASAAATIVLIVLTMLQVLLGELVPKTLALQYPTALALYTLVPMVPSRWLMRPFIAVLNGSGLALLRLLRAPTHGHRHIHSPEEIELLIAESRDGGLLEPDEHRRLQRALRLNLRPARELMVPRTRIAAVEIGTPLQQVVGILSQSPYSRLPVYRSSIDNVVGIIHTKDVVRWLVTGEPEMTLAQLLRPLPTVHESVTADRVLKDLREERSHQALVVDEFGGTAGLLTLENVLSVLVGAVGDEFKASEAVPEPLPDGRVRLPGSMPVSDAEAHLDTSWDTDAATIGGLVTEALGHLPAAGERVVVGNCEFEVERVVERAVVSAIAAIMAPDVQQAEGRPS